MHIDPKDWEQPGKEEIILRIIDGIEKKKGNVILLHDAGGKRDQTVAMLPVLIDVLQKNNYEVVSVSELLNISHDVIMPPITKQNKFVTSINNVTLTIADTFLKFLFFLFKTGIFLGIIRLIFMSILAIVHARKRRRINAQLAKQDFEPVVDVIVPAWNEESVIERTIDFLLQSNYAHFHIFVVDDGSTDDTCKVLMDAYAHNEKVTILTKKNGGKASALNYGIEKSHAPLVLALDADTLFTKDTMCILVRNFSDSKIGAVAGNTKVGNTINVLTKLQALEYITSQNLERRAADIINAIAVVPGAVGLWRRDALEAVGGFSQDTLAEDADLTVSIIKEGYSVVYDDEAIAYTEAPDVIKNFNKQRFRWMYGTLQTGWKHKNVLFRPKYGALGFFALPNIFIFQLLFQIIAPFIDIVLIIAVMWALWQQHIHQMDYSLVHAFQYIFFYYFLFLAMEIITAVIAMVLEPKPRRWSLLVWVIFQRFFYRQLLYFVSVKTVYTAIKGAFVGWGKFERKNTSMID
jgi:cellulose synthase/poly-beta-1,6-N-acetylglucosamine synthase-like glycosyltransferase